MSSYSGMALGLFKHLLQHWKKTVSLCLARWCQWTLGPLPWSTRLLPPHSLTRVLWSIILLSTGGEGSFYFGPGWYCLPALLWHQNWIKTQKQNKTKQTDYRPASQSNTNTQILNKILNTCKWNIGTLWNDCSQWLSCVYPRGRGVVRHMRINKCNIVYIRKKITWFSQQMQERPSTKYNIPSW